MYRFGERFVYVVPLLCVLAQACSSDSFPLVPSDAGTTTTDAAPATGDAATPTAAAVTVTIPPGANGKGLGGYVPNPAIVTAGSMVTWTNGDTIAHTATSTTGVWDSGAIPPGGSFSRVFAERGSFPYFCTIHGAVAMSGTIVVQ